MTLETFFEKFDQFADAPDAVAKMRELVLDLAVTGRLVAPEAEWPKRPLKSLATKIGSGATPAGGRESYFSEGIPLIRSMNVHFRGFDPTGLVFLSDEQAGGLSNVTVQPKDVLLNITGASIGRVTTAPSKMAGARVNQHVTIIRPNPELSPRFLTMFLASPSVQQMIDEVQVGATRQALTKTMIEQFQIPLPPLAEQKRIVAKVDELMDLCDRLEAQQQERETRHTALARASLARFADAPTPANLDFLFHTAYTIGPADLRKAILSLAVQGKLVPQDPNDEPAETFNFKLPDQLRAIAEMVGARFFLPEALVEACDGVPAGWGVAAIQSIGITQTGTTPSKSEASFTGCDIPFIKPGDIQGDEINYENEGLSADGLSAGRLIPKNSVLMVSIGGSIGKTAIVDRHVSCNQQINSVSAAECIEPRFVLTALRSGDFQNEVMSRAAQGTLPIISKGKWETIRIPIPPQAEQRRIVTKVDQLMALVDELETQLAASRATAEKLMEAVVAELTAQD
jgi:type I restriction enzyme S subunit